MNMKKNLLVLIAVFGLLGSAKAQLTNTKWKASFNVPSPVECLLDFKKDTVVLLIAADSTPFETMKYSVEKNIITIEKLSGGSPCDYQVAGKYKFEIKDDKLQISLVDDACNDRAGAWPTEPLVKVK